MSYLEELQHERQDVNAARLMADRNLEVLRRLLEAGKREQAERRVHWDYGSSATVEWAMEKHHREVERFSGEVAALDDEIADRLWQTMYPAEPPPGSGDLRDGDRAHELYSRLWDEAVGGHFADKGFGENGEILAAIMERLALGGFCQFVTSLRDGDATAAQRYCDLVTAEERRTAGSGCYNRLLVRRGADGKVLVVVDQPGNPEYVPPLIVRAAANVVGRRCRFGPRRRESNHGTPHRRRGSRRVTSRSAGGGGGGDDPDPEPRPALGRTTSNHSWVAA
jgi:hypothetical protein